GDRRDRRVRSGDPRVLGGSGAGRPAGRGGVRAILRGPLDRTGQLSLGEYLPDLGVYAGAQRVATTSAGAALSQDGGALRLSGHLQARAARAYDDAAAPQVRRETGGAQASAEPRPGGPDAADPAHRPPNGVE